MNKLSKAQALVIVNKHRPGVEWTDPEPVSNGGWIVREYEEFMALGKPSLYIAPDGSVIELAGTPDSWPMAVQNDMQDDVDVEYSHYI